MPHSIDKRQSLDDNIPFHPSSKISKPKRKDQIKTDKLRKVFTEDELNSKNIGQNTNTLSSSLKQKIKQFKRAEIQNEKKSENVNSEQAQYYREVLTSLEKSRDNFFIDCDILFEELTELMEEDEETCRESLKDIIKTNLWFATLINKRLASPLAEVDPNKQDPLELAVDEALKWIKSTTFLLDLRKASQVLEDNMEIEDDNE